MKIAESWTVAVAVIEIHQLHLVGSITCSQNELEPGTLRMIFDDVSVSMSNRTQDL